MLPGSREKSTTRLSLNGEGDVAPLGGAEAGELDADGVGARADRRENVGAVVTGDGGEREALAFVCDGHRGARQDRS